MSNALAIALAQKCVPKEEKALKYCLVGSAPVTAAGNLQLTVSCAVTEMFYYFRYSLMGCGKSLASHIICNSSSGSSHWILLLVFKNSKISKIFG